MHQRRESYGLSHAQQECQAVPRIRTDALHFREWAGTWVEHVQFSTGLK